MLTDVHGNEYIDGLSSLWNVAVGHGRAELGEAAAAQMSQLAFSNSYTGYANIPSIKLTEKLLSLVYPNMSGVFYANSGSEANDFAMKAARYFWFVTGKPEKVKDHLPQRGLSRRHDGGDRDHRHGAVPQGIRPGAAGVRPGADVLPVPLRSAAAQAGTCTLECADDIAERSSARAPDTVAAVIAEPVHGAGGVIPPCDGYWPRLREICDRHDVLLIADEVITGFGRTGQVVRARALGRAAGHHDVRQGRDQRLRAAVGLHRLEAGPRGDPRRAGRYEVHDRLHELGASHRLRGRPPQPADLRRRASRRARRAHGTATERRPRPPASRCRTSATSAASA